MIGEGLSPAARALLDSARDNLGPDAAAISRMRTKIGAAAGTAAATSATAAIGFKLGIVAVVATLAAGAALYGNRARTVTPPQIELPATRSDVHVPVVQSRVDAQSVTTTPATIEMAPMHAGHAKVVPTNATVVVAAAAEPAGIDLTREVELVDLAMAALRRGDTTAALAAIRKHRSETLGAGQLAEDAAAIEIEALCRRHDPTVSAKLDAFDARFPRSAQRSRLSTTCP